VSELHPEIEPYETGVLDVGAGNLVYWETCGNPSGKPALVVHGGPGSGCTPFFRRLFDPNAYRIVLFDQRNCGRSRPHASDRNVDLAGNNTDALVEDMERLRERLGVDRWLVLGGSWGSTLSLAYAERHPERVSEMVLFGVTTGRHSEVEWSFRGGLAVVFPAQWQRLADYAGGNDVTSTFARLIADRDENVRRVAAREWCLWESATMAWPPTDKLASRFEDPDYAVAFTRIVNHYVRHDLFLEDGVLLRNAGVIAEVPGVVINARWDLQAPIGNAWELSRVWPRAKLIVVDEGGHGAGAGVTREILQATEGFA
jgi:proline iminopeptidase